jgi:hypothetical protein
MVTTVVVMVRAAVSVVSMVLIGFMSVDVRYRDRLRGDDRR